VPQIDVCFEIDANGLVNVYAQDKMTGLEQAMQVTPASGLSPDEIDSLILEAETSVERDREIRELIMQRNRLENMIKSARKAMAEIGRAFPLEEQQEINGVLGDAENALSTEDPGELQSLIEKVEEASNRITSAMLVSV
jgi:molecular chaperone DnaK